MALFGVVVGGVFFSAVMTRAYTQQSTSVLAGELLSATKRNQIILDIGSLLGSIDVSGTGALSRYDVSNSAVANELVTAKWVRSNVGGITRINCVWIGPVIDVSRAGICPSDKPYLSGIGHDYYGSKPYPKGYCCN